MSFSPGTLGSYGRFGDSMIAHINPQEASVLQKMRGGPPSINPVTGLPEYFPLDTTTNTGGTGDGASKPLYSGLSDIKPVDLNPDQRTRINDHVNNFLTSTYGGGYQGGFDDQNNGNYGWTPPSIDVGSQGFDWNVLNTYGVNQDDILSIANEGRSNPVTTPVKNETATPTRYGAQGPGSWVNGSWVPSTDQAENDAFVAQSGGPVTPTDNRNHATDGKPGAQGAGQWKDGIWTPAPDGYGGVTNPNGQNYAPTWGFDPVLGTPKLSFSGFGDVDLSSLNGVNKAITYLASLHQNGLITMDQFNQAKTYLDGQKTRLTTPATPPTTTTPGATGKPVLPDDPYGFGAINKEFGDAFTKYTSEGGNPADFVNSAAFSGYKQKLLGVYGKVTDIDFLTQERDRQKARADDPLFGASAKSISAFLDNRIKNLQSGSGSVKNLQSGSGSADPMQQYLDFLNTSQNNQMALITRLFGGGSATPSASPTAGQLPTSVDGIMRLSLSDLKAIYPTATDTELLQAFPHLQSQMGVSFVPNARGAGINVAGRGRSRTSTGYRYFDPKTGQYVFPQQQGGFGGMVDLGVNADRMSRRTGYGTKISV